MCYFVTGTLKAETDIKNINEIAAPYDLADAPAFQEIVNKYVQNQLPEGTIYFWKSSGVCDCNTVIGWKARYSSDKDQAYSPKEALRLKRKGWSRAKIERWVQEKIKAHQKNLTADERNGETRLPEAERWAGFLKEVVGHREVSEFGLLLHNYTTGPEQEKIKLKERCSISAGVLSAALIMEIEEDVLYTFTKR